MTLQKLHAFRGRGRPRYTCYDSAVATLLDIRRLRIEFPAQRNRGSNPAAVRDLSLTIAPGEVLGLVGESGSGKSVTSLALMRLLPPHARVTGEIFYNNGKGPYDLLHV